MEKKKTKKTGRSGKVKKLTIDDLKKISGGNVAPECEFCPSYPCADIDKNFWKGSCV